MRINAGVGREELDQRAAWQALPPATLRLRVSYWINAGTEEKLLDQHQG